MKRIAVLSAAFAALSGLASAGSAQFEAGVAVVDITPPDRSVLDPLKAKALVLRQGSRQVALVICDVIGISGDRSTQIRKNASQKTGIPYDAIAVAATHTHSGGYHPQFVDRVVQALAEAHATLRPVTMQAGTAELRGVSFNRRFLMKDGTVRFNPGRTPDGVSFDGGDPYLNPDIVRPVGPIDPEVGFVLLIDAVSRRPRASLTTFALHSCTIPGDRMSADYAYFLEKGLRAKLGGDFVSIFGAGTCGDINHWDVSKPGPGNGYDVTERIGTALAATLKDAIPSLRAGTRPALAFLSETVRAPLQPYTEMDLAWARQARAEGFKQFGSTGYGQPGFLASVRARKILHLDELHKKGAAWPLDVQVFRLSAETAIVTLPGEVFVEHGLAIKKASPFANTLIVELANESCAYIPTIKAFSEGGYEVVNSRLVPGGGEMLVDAAVRMLKELRTK